MAKAERGERCDMSKMKRICRSLFLMAALAVLLAPGLACAQYGSKLVNQAETDLSAVPPVLQGRTFCLYDDGPSIELIKEQLQKLGYYRRMATFGGKFDQVMRSRVLAFQKNNAIPETGRADEITLAVLYGEGPVKGEWYTGADAEPAQALIIPVTNSAQWYQSAENEMEFRVTVKNVSPKRVITAYEAALYAVNAAGETVKEVPSLVMNGKIRPGETAWTTYVPMENPEEIASVYAALRRVRYEDGTYEIADALRYDCWQLQEETQGE